MQKTENAGFPYSYILTFIQSFIPKLEAFFSEVIYGFLLFTAKTQSNAICRICYVKNL